VRVLDPDGNEVLEGDTMSFHTLARLRALALLPLLALPTAGCIQFETLVKVKGDGTGTIVQTMTMSAETMEMMKSMKSDGGKAEAGKPMALEAKDIEQARSEAAKMGEGVTFVKAEPIDTKEARGMRAIYAFKDVTKLKISQKPSSPGGAPAPGGNDVDDSMKFGFSRAASGNAVLTVDMPDLKARPGSAKAPAKSPEAPPEAMAMMKQMFKGLRIAIAIEPEGRIVQSNSPYVEGSRVTLMEMSFDALLADEAKLKAFSEAMDGGSMADAKRLMKGMKGMKISLDPEVKIEFAAK
jgi:hypothetical protein